MSADYEDRILEAGLEEVVGGHYPPDLTSAILQAWEVRQQASLRAVAPAADLVPPPDGRTDLVPAFPGPGRVAVVENLSGTPCVGTSFGRAPRAYAAGDGPSSTAAADLDADGHTDLAVAAQNSMKLLLLRNVAGHFAEFQPRPRWTCRPRSRPPSRPPTSTPTASPTWWPPSAAAT